ncbi:neocarzinostatin apoprotein domain-containing protein [Nocardioides hankookensis]|uniref:Neocarzinostatin apoprotein domain-containing protein n=1 Tax=Nocardioides hankookensis TaxID=443157 RepID=A0ABW1LI92_9ACTN
MRRPMSLLARVSAGVAALVVVLVTAPPGFAAPTLSISQTDNLTDGQVVTISASGFEPNLSNIAIGQCTEDYVGPADCNTVTGAVFKVADASGNVAPFTIKVAEVFGGHDCTKEQCVIAGAPLPTNADAATIKANTYVAKISFGAAEAEPTAAATTAAADGGTLPKTGAGDSVPVLMLGASALLAAGIGVMLLVPGRRRGEHG